MPGELEDNARCAMCGWRGDSAVAAMEALNAREHYRCPRCGSTNIHLHDDAPATSQTAGKGGE